jgi:hypothetical protein
MTKAKKQSQVEESKAKRVLETPSTKSAESEVLVIWKNEVAELSKLSFKSMEEAAAALVGRVLERLRMEDDTKAKDFLVGLFEDDPVLQKELRSTLKIKE